MSADAEAHEALSCLRHVAALSQRLLAHARRGEWGALPALQEQYSDAVRRARALEPVAPPDAHWLIEKHSLLSRIRKDHDEVCDRVGPQLRRLGQALHTLQPRRDL